MVRRHEVRPVSTDAPVVCPTPSAAPSPLRIVRGAIGSRGCAATVISRRS
jgi:hypothetical protein